MRPALWSRHTQCNLMQRCQRCLGVVEDAQAQITPSPPTLGVIAKPLFERQG
jgi:hypothetical protein